MWNDRLSEFHVVLFPRERFPPPRSLPLGFSFVDHVPRPVEREILRTEFEHWESPFLRRFQGACEGSLVAITKDDLTVALSYLGSENEIGLRGYGQLHYPVIRSEFRGRGLSRALFSQLFQRAVSWRLDGVILVTNREGIPEFCERLGALRVGTLQPVRGLRRAVRGFVNPHRVLARRANTVLREQGKPGMASHA